jgi:hypothetical protein
VAALDRGEMCAVLRDFEAGIISLGGDEAAVARVLGYKFLHKFQFASRYSLKKSLPLDANKSSSTTSVINLGISQCIVS